MRRALLLGVVLTLVLGGTAQARPWLTMHRAERAALSSRLEPLPYLTDLAAFCVREDRTRIACDIRGFWASGDPDGPRVTCDNCTNATGQENWLPVLVTLRLHRAYVAENF